MKTRILQYIMFALCATTILFAQTAGDYGSVGTGSWGTDGSNWLVFVSASDWSDATAALGAPSALTNVWIRTGHTVNMEASSKVCKNLTIETGGAITTSASGSSLSINGDALVNGALGTSSAGPVVQFSVSGTISGSGSFYFSKLRPNAHGIKITVDMNINGYTATGNFLNCNNKTPYTLELKAGRSITLPTGGYISTQSNSSTSDPGTGANVTWDIYGTIIAPIASGGGISLANLTGFTSTLNVYNGGIVNTGRLSAVAAGTADPGAVNVNIFNGGSVTIEGGATATSNDMTKATLNVEGSFSTGSNLTSTNTIGNLTINNGSSTIISVPTTVTGAFTLTSGKITTTSANLLTIGSAGSVTGGSSSSFVDGPLAHTIASTSLTTKTFPIGKGTAYRPVELAITQGAATSTIYTAEVFNAEPVINTIPGTLGSVLSSVRYWNIVGNPATAITSSTVNLSYDADDAVTDFENLRIAQGPSTGGGAWVNLGGAGTANTTGTITSTEALTDYSTNSVYTLAQNTIGTNALPVELTSFKAITVGKNIELVWNTAIELNNIGFEIERRHGSIAWMKVGFVEGNGTSNVPHSYSFVDKVLAPAKYHYRLKQIDRDGQFGYGPTIEATPAFMAEDYALSQNYPNPFNPTTTFSFAVKQAELTTVKVYNLVGQEVAMLFNAVAQPHQLYSLTFEAKNLPSGIYFYALRSNSRNEVKKMMLMK